jgi:hypothetical protein
MLSVEERDKIQAATEAVVDMLGVPATWTQTKAPNATEAVVVGFKTASYKDEELINAFGIGAKVFTVKVSDIAIIEKFDRFKVLAETYTIDEVMPVHLNGVHIFHKCFVKGK